MGKDCGWEHPRTPALRWLWKDDAVGAVVDFLEGTRVGSRASAEVARGRVDEVRGEEAAWGGGGRRAGQARPRLMSFLCLSFVLYDTSLLSGGQGCRRKGSPGITLSGWGQDTVM